ncbi:MAG: PH domain-containing protein [Actinomycetota bacterium]|nr:PH domain-containing protein [Actinomycetota bacterium]
MGDSAGLPRVYRPLGARMVSGVSGVVLVAVVAFLWLMLPAHVQDQFGWIQRGTLIAFFVAVIVLLYGVFRTRVALSERGMSVTNGYRRHDFSWPQIVAISLTQHRPWALVDLADGSTMAVMALQTSDGPRATRSAREIAVMISARSMTDRDD